MIIKGEDGQIIVLRIESYEFPDSIDYDDGNWLRIYFNVKNRLGEWETIYPCLMTRDIKELITWLKNLANNIEPKWRDQEFLEPNISFYLLTTFDAEIKKIKIVLDLGTFRKEF